ncbi:MAG: hypothetical protein U0R81_13755 [Mycobacterium sp.]
MVSGGILALRLEFQLHAADRRRGDAGVASFAVTRAALLAPRKPSSHPGLPVAKFPDFSPVAVLVVLGLSAVMLVAYPEPPWRAEPPHAAADWVARSGLVHQRTTGSLPDSWARIPPLRGTPNRSLHRLPRRST